MRRLATFALCGSLVLLVTCTSLAAAPARRAGSTPKRRPAAEPRTAGPRTAEPRTGEPRAEPGRRAAPRPSEYKLAEPSPEVKTRVEKIRSGAKIMMYTGYCLSGLGLAATVAGAVLISVARGEGMQTGGVASLIVGAATLAGGAALWGVGRWRMNRAELLLIKAKMRQAQLLDPARRRHGAHALALPKTHTVVSAQLRF